MRDGDVQKPPGIAEAIDWLAALDLLGVEALDAETIDRTLGSVLKYGEDQEVIRAAGLDLLVRQAVKVETVHLDLPATVGAFARRLHDAGLPMTPARSADLARALALVEPVSRRRLYWTARAIVVTDPTQVKAFDAVFAAVFGGAAAARRSSRRARRPRRAASGRARGRAGARRAGAAAERCRGARREALRRARAARARSALPADVAAAARDAAAPHPTLRAWPRSSDRHAAHAAPQPAHGRRADAPGAPPPPRAASPARAPLRHLGLDGALRARLPAVPHLGCRQRQPRRDVRLRHAAHAAHPRARLAQPRAGDPARRGDRARLVQRHADRRRAEDLQRPPRTAGPRARRGGGDHLGRLGARRPRARGPSRWSGSRASRTGSCGSTRA